MTRSARPTVVFVPGLRDHVRDHWQTLTADRLARAGRAVHTVAPLTVDRLSRAARVAALDDLLDNALSRDPGPILLVGHSAGTITIAHWAQRHRVPIQGALLATPPDFETPLPDGYPTPEELAMNGWTPVPRAPLPFPSVVAASANDPLAAAERVARLAGDWGSRLVELGPVGHLNPASGFGEWSRAEELLHELVR
ncbi:alpha/beta fold hydrolase (plasmid) [Embleya sp. NBC_00888]|uniref:RBBP9/YdeN family alpha/beta hydrolase n=1 Tax=Embleya sp. NBC_00888 TaxID=2975960 RepID=UPI002F914DC9|nr:alpha/beta fold hydrolase [Embleya sp. NBC_00888]